MLTVPLNIVVENQFQLFSSNRMLETLGIHYIANSSGLNWLHGDVE